MRSRCPNGRPFIQGKVRDRQDHGLSRRQEQQPDLDPGRRGHLRLGRSGLHLWHLRIPLQGQRWQADRAIRQVHQHLEEAERWKLEGRARHGELPARNRSSRSKRTSTISGSASGSPRPACRVTTRRQRRRVGLLHRLHAAEVLQQSPRRALAHARNLEQFGRRGRASAGACDGR